MQKTERGGEGTRERKREKVLRMRAIMKCEQLSTEDLEKILTSKEITPLLGFVTFDTKIVPATVPIKNSP